MDFTKREITGTRHAIDLTLNREEFSPYLDERTKRLQKNAAVKGFRPGKVPKDVVKKLYGSDIQQDALESAIQTVFAELMQANPDIKPFSQPALTKADITDDGTVEATVVYDVLPEFELGEYKGIQGTRIYHVVSDEEVALELERLRERQMKTEPAEQITDDGYIATIDLHRIENGVVVFDNPFRDIQVFMRRPEVNKDLKENLLNAKVNDSFRISLPTGEDKAMTLYQATVKDIQRAMLPEADDVFAADVTGDVTATMERLTETIRESILFEYTQRYSRMFRDELIGRIVDAHSFDVPESLVHNILDSFLDETRNRYQNRELPKGFNYQKFHDEMHPSAERTARWVMIRDRIAEAEQVVAEDTDYDALADIESQYYNVEFDKMLDMMKKSPEIENRIISEKVLQMIEDYAIATDVLDSEHFKQEEEQAEGQENPEEPKKLITL